MRLSVGQLDTIRNRSQFAKVHLSIFEPRTVMQARVNNASITKGARTIAYDTVSLGSYVDVEAGMTLLIGSTAGGKDIGRIRIRSATAGAFTVSENNNINWQDNQYLTVLRYWEVWPIFPRIIGDPADPENVIFYKDYDIAYTNQNAALGTFVCAGPHRANFLDGGSAREWYTSSGTYNLRGSSLTYEWAFEGGTPTGSTSANPGYVTYTAPGQYVTRLIVRGSLGEVDTTYRYVSIYDKPENGVNVPPLMSIIKDFSGSRDEGGYRVALEIHEDIQIDDNAVVVLFYDADYGSTHGAMGGNAQNAGHILFSGYVDSGTITYDYAHHSVSFEAVSITGLMRNTLGFAISTESKAAPSKWYEIFDLDVRRALYHYLKWHSTVLSVADFRFEGTDQKIQYFDSDRESLFDAIDNLMRGTLIGEVCADRQGAIFAEVGPVMYSNPTGTFTPVMAIQREDWINAPVLDKKVQDEYSYVERGGIAYSGAATGTFGAFLACAPGAAPSFRGKTDHAEGLAISGQAHLNQIVGNLFANFNIRYPAVTMDMAGMFTNLDIAPFEVVSIHLNPEDTPENKNIDLLANMNQVTWTYDALNGILIPNMSFKSLVSGISGDSIIIPVSVDDSEGGGSGFSVPSIQIPNIPLITIPPLLGTLTDRPFIAVQGPSTNIIVNDGDNCEFTPYTKLFESPTAPNYFTVTSAGVYISQPGTYLVFGSAVCVPQVGADGNRTMLEFDFSAGFLSTFWGGSSVNKTTATEPYNDMLPIFSVVNGIGTVGLGIRKNYAGWAYASYPTLVVLRLY